MKTSFIPAKELKLVTALSLVSVALRAQEPTVLNLATNSAPAAEISTLAAGAQEAASPIVAASDAAPEHLAQAQEKPSAAAPAPTSESAALLDPDRLPYGAEDILKLTRAQVGETLILSFVENSGTIYTLTADDLVNLRNKGVSERVLTAMLEQRKKSEIAANSQVTVGATPATSDYVYSAPPAYYQAPPAPVYVSSPEPVVDYNPSTLYVIPYPASQVAYVGRPSSSTYHVSGYYGGYSYPSTVYTVRGGFGYGGGYGCRRSPYRCR